MSVTVTAMNAGLTFRRRYLGALVLWLFGVLLALAFFASVGWGAGDAAPLLALLAEALGVEPPWPSAFGETASPVSVRLPRTLVGVLSGAALAVSGAALQGLFRSPLADPALIGVSTGSALAVVAAMALGAGFSTPPAFHVLVLPGAACAGGLLAAWLVYRVASREGRTDAAAMLLAGVGVNAAAAAGIGLLVFVGAEQPLRQASFWLLGSLGGTDRARLLAAAPVLLGAVAALPLLARHLNALLLGEREALHLGFHVERTKRLIVVLAALATGASVALTGVIGFIGLVAPHLVRAMVGPDHRTLLPAVILLGASSMLLADLAARAIVLPAELPIGILTGCIGGPFLLWLLTRRRGPAGDE